MSFRIPRKSRRQGFTLVELLIVLAILVMLLALVVPRFLGVQKKADRQTALAQVKLFKRCLENYTLDTRSFPTTEQGLAALISAPAESEEGGTTSDWAGPYVSENEVPLDPWGHEYQYAYPPERGGGEFPDIWSLGPDGEDGTEDDIVSWSGSSSGEGGDELGGDLGSDLDMDVDVDVDLGGDVEF